MDTQKYIPGDKTSMPDSTVISFRDVWKFYKISRKSIKQIKMHMGNKWTSNIQRSNLISKKTRVLEDITWEIGF